MSLFNIYSTDSLDSMGKKFTKVEIISRAPNRNISLVPCILDGMLEKLCLKPEQQTGKLPDIWGEKKFMLSLEE